ncbi:hypothetical protein DMC14_002450 [Metamycoplasma phocicerebrale]|uniref:Membrane protein P80 n=1 Tax=Metamycoplasma phocicerebrale TaxID=142649 RepID=A0A3T0TU40_9BACT|nr:hypothetical protein [Metamycoplasma phocicerebrale]AZZ65631.1 hypothetical protein DMC14_002450 [Metamycoplasma phocicerebrale]
MSNKVKKTNTTEQKTKRKRVLWGTFWATAVTATVAAGIAIPLVKASKSLPSPTDTLEPDSSVLEIDTPNGKKQLKYKEIDKAPVLPNKNKNIADSIEKTIAKYLYEQEYESSLWYQAVYNANKAKADEKTFALDSVEKIKEKVKKQIDDLKKQYQKQYGLEKKWEEKFLEKLNSKEWGSSKNENEAIEHKVNEEIKRQAFRRFETEVNTDWTFKDLKDGIVANKDVYYEYKGKKIEIAKKGEKIILSFAKENENYVLPKEDSVESHTDSKASIKIPMFVTKSFVKQYKDATRFIKPWISKKQGILSEFSLSAHQDQKGAEKPWIVTKEEIINLLKFSSYEKSKTEIELKLGIDGLKQFKGFGTLIKSGPITEEDERQATNDKQLINFLSSDKTNAGKFGSKGFVNLKQTISSSEPTTYLNLLSILLGDATSDKGVFKYKEENNLFDTLKTSLINVLKELESFKDLESTYKGQLLAALQANPATKNKSDNYVAEYAKYNDSIKKIIDELQDKDFNRLFGNAFKTAFTGSNPGNKVNAIYKVGENFVTVGPKGILIQNLHKLDNEEEIKKLIVKDLTIKSKANYSPTFTSELFDLTKIFSGILNSSFQLEELLSQSDFKKYVKEQEYTPIDSNTKKKFDDADISGALDYIRTIEQSSQTTLISNKFGQIRDYVKKQSNDGLIEDFKFDESNNIFKIVPHTGDIVSYLFKIITDYVVNKK